MHCRPGGEGKPDPHGADAGMGQAAVDDWLAAAGFSAGPVLGAINKSGRITGQGMSAQSVYEVVEAYSRKLGVPIAPRDVRRTFAKLAHKGRAPLEQIQICSGHASIQTTERYLGVEQDLTDAPCDHLGIRLSSTTHISISTIERNASLGGLFGIRDKRRWFPYSENREDGCAWQCSIGHNVRWWKAFPGK